jgi:hypothetical protein
VNAIATIRDVMNKAAEGDDPWVLSAGTVDISFAITQTGTISLGVDGELVNELTHTHTLRLGLVRSHASARRPVCWSGRDTRHRISPGERVRSIVSCWPCCFRHLAGCAYTGGGRGRRGDDRPVVPGGLGVRIRRCWAIF